MSIQIRQNSKGVEVKDIIASMSARKPSAPERQRKNGAGHDAVDAMTTLRALAHAYERIADRLLDQIHDHADNAKVTEVLSQHLDWVGTRAQLVDGFIKAGDCALAYICASPDAHARLMPLVQLTAQHAARSGQLPVALFLMEKIDEELCLV